MAATNKKSAVTSCITLSALLLVCVLHNQSLYLPNKSNRSLAEISEGINIENQCLEFGSIGLRNRPTPNEVSKCLIYIKPSESIDTLMKMLVGLPIHGSCQWGHTKPPFAPYKHNVRRFGEDWPPYGFTMIGHERMENFRAAINEVNRNNIPGAIMELGVWRGGAMILAAALQKEAQIPRDLYLFDAFGELPNDGYGNNRDFLAVNIEQVIQAFQLFGLYDEEQKQHVHFVKGLFQQTTKEWQARKDPIAVLRIDGNFYDSYQDSMYALYENVPVGGIVIFDDVFSHAPVMQFWLDFQRDQKLTEELVRIDHHSGWFRKTKDAVLDQSKQHPPQDCNKII